MISLPTWDEIEIELIEQGLSERAVDIARLIFFDEGHRSYLCKTAGCITDNAIARTDLKNNDVDILSMDLFDLDEHINSGLLTPKQAGSIPTNTLTLLDVETRKIALAVAEENEGNDSLGFSYSLLVATSFPLYSVKGIGTTRIAEKWRIDLAGTLSHGMPWGTKPRLIFIYICSQARKTDSPLVRLPRSLKSLVTEEFCLSWSTGERGTASRWIETFTALCDLQISASTLDTKSGQYKLDISGMRLFDDARLWQSTGDNDDDSDEAYVMLSPQFFKELKAHSVPLNFDVVKELIKMKVGPLPIDLYIWCSYRAQGMKFSKLEFPWSELKAQFGSQSKELYDFKRTFIKALNIVSTVYPGLNYSVSDKKNFILQRSPPAINERLYKKSMKKLPPQ